jgi:hypothetical protein
MQYRCPRRPGTLLVGVFWRQGGKFGLFQRKRLLGCLGAFRQAFGA